MINAILVLFCLEQLSFQVHVDLYSKSFWICALVNLLYLFSLLVILDISVRIEFYSHFGRITKLRGTEGVGRS